MESTRLSSYLISGFSRGVRFRRSIYRIGIGLLITIAAMLATGCGVTGGTQRFKVDLGGAIDSPIRRIQVATVKVEADANLVQSTGTYTWGAFNAKDAAILKASLVDTLNGAVDGLTTDTATPLRIHLLVRRYIVAHSNNAGGVLACVSWCLSGASESVVFQETFYASASGHLVTTIGQIKDSVNRAIVKRIGLSVEITFAHFPGTASSRNREWIAPS